MKVSVIIPTYNEAATLSKLLQYLLKHSSSDTEIIVADGGSSDITQSIASNFGVKVLACERKGRAAQMNAGAAVATGDILYFLHADTYPPATYEQQITDAIEQGYGSGCYRLKFDQPHWFLQINAWFTRFDIDAIRFGDQSLFVWRDVFEQVQGFNEKLLLMEDQEIIGRLRKHTVFKVLPDYVITSARKYKKYGVYKLQSGYFLIYTLYKLGASQEQLIETYHWLTKSK